MQSAEKLSPTAVWRQATIDDRESGLEVRWMAPDGSWRYPRGIQAENLLHFDTTRCEVRVV